MKPTIKALRLFTAGLLLAGCATQRSGKAADVAITGAWRSRVQFSSAAFAPVIDLEFLDVFYAGGTMNESSNYDGVPPVPPASGVWRQPGPREFEAKYVFFSTKPPAKFEDIASGGGWLPAGRGGLTERILVAADGRHFKSKLRYEAFDTGGKRLTAAGRPRVLVSASNLNRWTCCCSLGEISRATLGLEFSTRSVIRRRND